MIIGSVPHMDRKIGRGLFQRALTLDSTRVQGRLGGCRVGLRNLVILGQRIRRYHSAVQSQTSHRQLDGEVCPGSW